MLPFEREFLLAGAIMMASGNAWIRADIVQVHATADATMIETAPSNNLGGHPFFNAGTTGNGTFNRGLFLFDLTGLVPSGSTIQSASVTLTVVGGPPFSLARDSLFALNRVLRPWGEGDGVPENPGSPGLGAPALLDEVTWTHRFYGTDETWAVPGGLAGVDFVSQASSVEFVESTDVYVFDVTPRLIADVQGWVNDPSSNFGWMLMSFDEDVDYTAKRFGAEDPLVSPLLTVVFQPIPEPGTSCLIILAVGGLLNMGRCCAKRASLSL